MEMQLHTIFTEFFHNVLLTHQTNMLVYCLIWICFVLANHSDEGEQYVPGYNGASKGGRNSGE